jgi:acetyltransferase-like isoleucine patch superfamily enzyme
MRKIRFISLIIIGLLPSFLKKVLYRLCFGYKIGKNVTIGFSILDAKNFTIADNVFIGHLNLFVAINDISIGDSAKIGHMNIFRGGQIRLGRFIEILRQNEINAIPNPIAANEVDSTFIMGDGGTISTGHKIDFTDRVTFGKLVILGGRNSSLWTHNRQNTKPIFIGDYCYLGSEIRITPGVEIAPKCIIGIASVITKKFTEEYKFIAGVPAKVVADLTEEQMGILDYKRPDIPDYI